MQIRDEAFGGVVCTEKPDLTVFVGRDYMRKLGYADSPMWSGNDKNCLTAPITAHLNLADKCNKSCEYCYDNQLISSSCLSFDAIKAIIDSLSDMRVFTVALGGGEPFLRDDIFEIARYARSKNLIPTVTTNGTRIDPETAVKCRVFNHIHISADISGEEPLQKCPWSDSIRMLQEAGVEVGVNYLVDKRGYERLEEIYDYGNKHGISTIMLLRLKPSGKARKIYMERRLSYEQNRGLYCKIAKLAKKRRINTSVDCSFFPMIAWHRPNKKKYEFWGAQGCNGGNYYIEVNQGGSARCCSFSHEIAGKATLLNSFWDESPAFNRYRDWTDAAQSPCRTCEYLQICRGGCHAIAEELTGNSLNPDPECPRVVEYSVVKP